MRRMAILVAAALAAAPAVAQAPYQAPASPADPTAHLAEMLALYDEICLHAFPDDGAVARDLAARGAIPLSDAELRVFLHDDPGRGWRLRGRTARFDITIEQSPPYHACAVRTMTAAGFPSLQSYQDLADRFEAGRGYAPINLFERDVGEVHVAGGGEAHHNADGSSESLLVAITTPQERFRAAGNTAVEVRFAHQLYQPAAQAPEPKS